MNAVHCYLAGNDGSIVWRAVVFFARWFLSMVTDEGRAQRDQQANVSCLFLGANS